MAADRVERTLDITTLRVIPGNGGGIPRVEGVVDGHRATLQYGVLPIDSAARMASVLNARRPGSAITSPAYRFEEIDAAEQPGPGKHLVTVETKVEREGKEQTKEHHYRFTVIADRANVWEIQKKWEN